VAANEAGGQCRRFSESLILSMRPIRQYARFSEFQHHHHAFERALDASTFVAVTKTYGVNYTAEQFGAIERIINEDFGGVVTKVKDAALYLSIRL
jgi:hypothetical protein